MKKSGPHDTDFYTTKDGSFVRELMHPDSHTGIRQSLAEATVPAGVTTFLHRHGKSDEIYHITGGQGRIFLGNEQAYVSAGVTVYIPRGTPHKIENTGHGPLTILCFCCPAYGHADTELLT